MLTSESNNVQIQSFFRAHHRHLIAHIHNLVNKKYSHSLIKKIQRGEELPPIFGSYKEGNLTFYSSPIGLKKTRIGFEFEDLGNFIIMNSLREQSKIMITATEPNTIIYNAHAIRRYRERTGLEDNLDFIEVCKDMYLAGCNFPSLIVDNMEIYGTDINCRVAKIICAKGTFIGYKSFETNIVYATTFLLPNDLRQDQEYLDPNKNPYIDKELWLNFTKRDKERVNQYTGKRKSISVEEGKMKILSQEEVKTYKERFIKKLIENPNFFEDQIELNRQRALNRIKRKGYR